MSIKFSVVMPTYDDFDGVYFTLHALWLYHKEYLHEVVVLDNNPGTRISERLEQLCKQCNRTRYIPYKENIGTAAAKNKAFESASGEYVVCIDSHILLLPDCLKSLAEYYQQYPDAKDLLQGPLVADNHIDYYTHLDEVWGNDIRGKWQKPTVAQSKLKWFAIPNMGMGMFCCRKDSWQGFNPAFKGFGGEEWYIHTKFRQANCDTLCIMGAKWVHRFSDEKRQPSYPLHIFDRVRNYYIGYKELGLDVKEVYNHYILKGMISPADWQAIEEGKDKPCATCGQATYYANMSDWHVANCNSKSDINEHLDTLRKLSRNLRVVDCGDRPQLTLPAFIQGGCFSVTHIGTQKPQGFATMQTIFKDTHWREATSMTADVVENDLLFIDTDPHTKEHVLAELNRWHMLCEHYIVLHDTFHNNQYTGVMDAIREFVRENTDWTVIDHFKNNNGLIVLSCDAMDKKQLPGAIRKAINFTTALAEHVKNGRKAATPERIELRMQVCDTCQYRNGEHCGDCGCPLDAKLSWESSECPLGYWK